MLQCTGRISSSLEMPTRFEVKVLFCGGPLKMRWHGGKTMFFWLTFRKVSKISISKLDEDPKKVDIKRCRRNVSSEIVWHCVGYFWQSCNNWRWWLHRLLFTWLVTLSSQWMCHWIGQGWRSLIHGCMDGRVSHQFSSDKAYCSGAGINYWYINWLCKVIGSQMCSQMCLASDVSIFVLKLTEFIAKFTWYGSFAYIWFPRGIFGQLSHVWYFEELRMQIT